MNWDEEIKNIIPKKDKRLMNIEEIGEKIQEELKEYDVKFFIAIHYPEKDMNMHIDNYCYKVTLDDILRLELNEHLDTEEAIRYIAKENLKKRMSFKMK